MIRTAAFTALLTAILPLAAAAAELPADTVTAVVMIANYDADDEFRGWGSGFFVDEGIVVTNRHVIEGGDHYRVYATGQDGRLDHACYRDITRSDVRLNLEDDVAYMRVYLPCAHGVVTFADDPAFGDEVSVLGYTYKGSTAASLDLTVTSGEVVGREPDGWLQTDAMMDRGNSGGPVIGDAGVVGVAVAKGIDDDGNFLVGLFVPSSVIEAGLLYANDADFGYIPRSRSSVSRASSVSSVRSSSVSSAKSSSASSVRSSARPSVRSSARPMTPLQLRTCARVLRRFKGEALVRVNERLQRRLGFICR